jgi:tape measure domain-containing protein
MSDIVVGIKLKADGSGLVGELKSASGQVEQFNVSVDKTNKTAKTGSTAVSELNKTVNKTAAEARTAASQTNELNVALDKTEKEAKTGSAAVSGLNKTIDKTATEARSAASQTIQFNLALDRTDDNARAGSSAVKNLNQSLDRTAIEARSATREIGKTGNVTEQFKRQALGLGAILASGFAVRDLIRYADQATNVKNKITDVTNSSEELVTMQKTLLVTANATRTGLSATADLYSTLSRNARELVDTDQDLIDITGTITKAFALSGATTAEADGAIRQLSQGLAAGALRGDEFNSVAEGAPEIMRAIAKQTGLTTGELREFAAEGKITADIVVQALQNAAQGIDVRFSKMAISVEQSMTVAQNNLIDFIGAQNDAYGVTQTLGQGIVGLSENLDTMQDVLVLSASIMAGRYVGAIVAATVAKAGLLRQELLSVPAMNAGYAGLGRKVVALSSATIATNALTISMRGLNVAMGFLGGPVGLAIAAGAALFYFANQSETAKEETGKLSTEIDTLTKKYLALNEAGRKIELSKLTQQEELARAKILALQEKIAEQEDKARNRGPATNQFSGIGETVAIAKLQTEMGELDAALTAITKKKSALFDATLNIDDINQTVSASTQKFKAANDDRIDNAIDGYQYETDAYSQELQLRLAVLNGSLTKEEAAIYGSLWQKENAQKQQTKRLEQQVTAYYDSEIEKVKANADAVIALEQQKADRLAEIKRLARDNEVLLQQEHQLNLDIMNQGFWGKMRGHMAVTSDDFNAMWGSTFENFAQGIGDATASAILEQKNFGDAARAIARGALSELISGLVQLGVKKLALAAIEKTIGVTGAAAATATAAATGAAMATAYAPAAAFASLASFGANSAPAMAGITTTVGLSESLALAGIAHDGLPINRNEGTYLVRRDEMVLNPKQRENFEQVVENTKDGGNAGGNTYHFTPTIIIDATNAAPGMEAKIRDNVNMALNEYDAKLQEDFSNNGTRSRLLTGRVA